MFDEAAPLEVRRQLLLDSCSATMWNWEDSIMKVNIKALGFTLALLWGGAVFLVGLANLTYSDYGSAFLNVVASIYPGYQATPSFGDVAVGTLYALADGFIGGLVAGWIYNLFVGRRAHIT
jgi:hypothetical protein